ncbi:MAG TPA: hypothetical protein DG761_00625 [Gammaproteobacteria bacterium]|jgi:hypothetical protein|nr:hypothetical protein [Acidiferrobacteraceae bacterium]MDP6399318.1 L,D-transpeptidase family protein [Arenicellales bacterium]MDP6552953.1 L,D-transpeptidase family protein [Arenicellales bacterium]MDP6919182.1 L,D-transpeptidase family protein [Arenicellales bacterium]HCX86508.1 hypothetical protein [Gammaproteobacteria bacterium]|tara:strand:- start:21 stop:1193 length:1173 start_codon:yes stop_codon:yes gene_type:complete
MKAFTFTSRLMATLLLATALPSAAMAGSDYETRLVAATDAVIDSNWTNALGTIDELKADFPLSRIAHLLHADLLSALAGASDFGRADPAIADLRQQLQLRWRHTKTAARTKNSPVPAKLLQVSAAVPFVLYVDLPSSRLHVFAQQNGHLVPLSDYYITIGRAGFGKEREGDLKTPVGVYQVDGYIPGGELHARYGAGALTTDYPNTLDRFLNRTGFGIWLHGTEPGWINRGPRASEGCITLSNADFEELVNQFGSHRDVPIVIDDVPKWIPVQKLQQNRNAVITSITASADRPIETSSGDHHETPAMSHGLDKSALFTDLVLYPGKEERLLTRWMASDQTDSMAIEQYWHRTNDGRWQVTLQTSVPLRAPQRLTADTLTPSDSKLNSLGN